MNTMKPILLVVVVLAALSLGWMFFAHEFIDDPVVSEHGLHWQIQLDIQKGTSTIPIPATLGTKRQVRAPITTRDGSGTIYLDFDKTVDRDDLLLANVFLIWGRDMHSFGSLERMRVNGVPNTEYGNYELHDGDHIELQYE